MGGGSGVSCSAGIDQGFIILKYFSMLFCLYPPGH
jgi:hypothetical protein